MLSYVAFVWNELDNLENAAAREMLNLLRRAEPNWRVVLDRGGLVVCYRILAGRNIDDAYVLTDGQGVVLGKLFDRAYAESTDAPSVPPQPVSLGERRCAALVSTAGHDLIDRYWGRYVAFINDPSSGKRWVLRDPTGKIPCYSTKTHGVDLYFSRIVDIQPLNVKLSVNTHYLVGCLLFSTLTLEETGFNEVSIVLSGQCVEHDRVNNKVRSFYWSPLQFSERDVIEDPEEAVRLTRRVVRACVYAWASCFQRILLDLSGGIDSSILLASLNDAPTRPEVFCLNWHTGHPSRDERRYARAAARRAGLELLEWDATTVRNTYDLERYDTRVLAPFLTHEVVERPTKVERLARDRGIEADFFGHLGDELFGKWTPLPASTDYVWRHGLRPKLIPMALDDAVMRDVTLWRVLRAAVRFGTLRRPLHPRFAGGKRERLLMKDELREAALRDDTLWHPLYRDANSVPPNKYCQAFYVTSEPRLETYPFPSADTPAEMLPFVSQPLMELSMRIPTYLQQAGGRDRVIARKAFAESLPREILVRRFKCSGDVLEKDTLRTYRERLRCLLLDGYLVQQGFLERSRVDSALSDDVSAGTPAPVEIRICAHIEIWSRAWAASNGRIPGPGLATAA